MNLKGSQYAAIYLFVLIMCSSYYCYITKYPITPLVFSQKLADPEFETGSVGQFLLGK